MFKSAEAQMAYGFLDTFLEIESFPIQTMRHFSTNRERLKSAPRLRFKKRKSISKRQGFSISQNRKIPTVDHCEHKKGFLLVFSPEISINSDTRSNKTGTSQVGAISKAQKYSRNNY